MLREIRKNLFRNSVRDLFINRMSVIGIHSAQLELNSFSQYQGSAYREILSWVNFNDQTVAKYQPQSLKMVNQAFADSLNKYEAASLLVCHFLAVDIDEEGDWLVDDTESEYSKIYSLFDKSPMLVHRLLSSLRDRGDISSKIGEIIEQKFSALFQKYPELKQEEPEQPAKITWWELAYNDSKKDKHIIAGRFLTVSELVKYIENKEGGNNLFWKYPFKCQYDDWEPTVPPTNDWDEKSVIAIPRRGWEALWKEYQGISVGANFDHWQALKRQAYIRPKDKDIIIHQIIGKPYQRTMSLEIGAG